MVVASAPATSLNRGRDVTTTVLVTAQDFSFKLSRRSVPVGTTRFVVTNAGVLPHDFAIAGRKTSLLKHGARATVIVRFHRARTYAYRSSLPGEAALGMRGVIVVGGPEPPSLPPPPPARCSDSGAGNPTQPFCKIAPAASRLTPGQTVVVLGGAYNETVVVSSSGAGGAPINFVAASGRKVSVIGTATSRAYGFYLNGRNHITIQGFDVTGTGADGILVKSSSNITIRDNHVSHAGRPVRGELATGIRLEGTNDSVVARNTVDDNTNYGIYLESGSTRNQIVGNRVFRNARVIERAAAGIGLLSSPGNTVSGNISHDNEDSGIAFLSRSDNSLDRQLRVDRAKDHRQHSVQERDGGHQRGSPLHRRDDRQQHQRRQRDRKPAHTWRHSSRIRLNLRHDDELRPRLSQCA